MGSWCAAERRGVTMLEVIVALTLLVAVSAIVLPSAFAARERAVWAACEARLETAVSVALEESATAARVCEVRARVGSPRDVVVVFLDDVSHTDEGSGGPDAPAAGGGGETPPAPGRFVVSLPEGCSLTAARDADDAGTGLLGGASFEDDVTGERAPGVLGWALPGGTFVGHDGCRVEVEGASGVVTIAPWSGRVSVEMIETASADGLGGVAGGTGDADGSEALLP